MKKTGIMGGTFNPIHNAHLLIARYAMEQYGLDEIIFMTSGNPPHKRGMDMPSAEVRHAMVCLGVKDDADFCADDYEVRQTKYSYSVNTLRALKNSRPNEELYFIIGEDSLRDLPEWYMPEEIVKLCVILVYPRNENSTVCKKAAEMQKKYGGDIRVIDSPVIGISSTEIRNRLKEGKSIRHMLPDSVLEYIENNGVY